MSDRGIAVWQAAPVGCSLVARWKRGGMSGRGLTSEEKPTEGDDARLAAVGLSAPSAEDLTNYAPDGIRRAALPDLLVRGLARGDEHPVEGVVVTVADELEAAAVMMADGNPALGTLLGGWAIRLRVGAELVRRYREAAT